MNRTDALLLFKDSGSPSGALRHIALLKAFETVLKPYSSLKILEAGCGEGGLLVSLAALYPECNFTGVDISEKQISKAAGRLKNTPMSNVKFIQSDLLTSDIAEKFDIIYVIDVLQFVEKHQEFIEKLFELQNDAGYLFIHTPVTKQKFFVSFIRLWEEGQVREGYSLVEIKNLLGNKYVLQDSFFTFGFYGNLASEIYRMSRNLLFLPFFLLQWFLIPLSYRIAYKETIIHNRSGNGIFVIAKSI